MKRIFIVLLATAFIGFSGRAAFASPVFTFNINGTAFDAAMLNCGQPGNQSVCSGTNLSGSGFVLNSWQFVLDPDPSIAGSFTLTNLSNATLTFTVSATLGVSPVSGPLSISGYVGAGTLTDLNGGGATLSDVGVSLYGAMIDGSSVHTLLDPPQSYTVVPGPLGPGAPVTIPLASFGPQGLNQSIGSSIGVAFPGFSLTAGDSIQFPFGFDATPATPPTVPEPGSLLLLGSGLATLAARRRRSA